MNNPNNKFKSFKDFYPYYLKEHQNKVNRILHFIGTSIVVFLLILFLLSKSSKLLILVPITGYSFAWIGHLIFEKNKPATFKYPLYSLMGDFLMWWQLLTKKIYF